MLTDKDFDVVTYLVTASKSNWIINNSICITTVMYVKEIKCLINFNPDLNPLPSIPNIYPVWLMKPFCMQEGIWHYLFLYEFLEFWSVSEIFFATTHPPNPSVANLWMVWSINLLWENYLFITASIAQHN